MQLYTSSSKVNGCGFSASFNGVDKSLFFGVVRQSSWDSDRKVGAFAGPKTVVKLSLTEAGGILDSITRNVEFNAYHKSKDAVTQVFFKPYLSKGQDGQETQRGFGLSIVQEKNGEKSNWLMPFSWGNARLLEQYIQYFLRVAFSIEESENKKNFKERQDKKQVNAVKNEQNAQDEI